MIDVGIMEKMPGKNIKVHFKDGDIWERKLCTNYYRKDDDEEEPMLEFGDTIIFQSEIESIEVLD